MKNEYRLSSNESALAVFMRHVACVLAALACVAAVSCGGRHGRTDARADSLTAMLAAVDDSVAVNSPRALALINEGMAKAQDSLDYYDWYLRLMRYSVQRSVPDTAALRWRHVQGYLSAQKQTPRVRGMPIEAKKSCSSSIVSAPQLHIVDLIL